MKNAILLAVVARLAFTLLLIPVFLYGTFKKGRTPSEEKEFFVECAIYILTFEVLVIATTSALASKIFEQIFKTYTKMVNFIMKKIIK